MDKASRERRASRKADHVAGAAASEPRRGPKSCSSRYKGVTKHRRTGRWEAHIWGRAFNKGPGKQIYLGGFVTPEEAAEAHDLAALQLQGPNAKTNFHISKYADWLATLHATPSNDNLPLQLRRAGMFKRCSDRAKRQDATGAAPPPTAEPDTPLGAEAQRRASRGSDSSQTADASPSCLSLQDREESVTSQACAQAAPGTLRRPLPMRYSTAPSADARLGGGSAALPSYPANSLQHTQLPEALPPVLQSRSIPAAVAQPLASLDASRQPALLGWKSFQALAQAQATAGLHPAHLPPSYALQAPPHPLLPPPPGLTSPHLPQLPTSEAAYGWPNTSGSGGIMYGDKHCVGFLTPEQVRWLEASGVRFPEHLQLPQVVAAAQPSSQPPQPSGQHLLEEAAAVAPLEASAVLPLQLKLEQPQAAEAPLPQNSNPGPTQMQQPSQQHLKQQQPPPTEPVAVPAPGKEAGLVAEGPASGTPKKRTTQEDQQIAEALLGLKAAQ